MVHEYMDTQLNIMLELKGNEPLRLGSSHFGDSDRYSMQQKAKHTKLHINNYFSECRKHYN